MGAYDEIISRIFCGSYKEGMEEVPFARPDLERVAGELGLHRPKNLGDIIYTFRFRKNLPDAVRSSEPKGYQWIIRQRGDGLYAFVLVEPPRLEPAPGLLRVKIPDATPGIIMKYALDDEQALLAKVRYNRIVDIFAGITCYSLQSHLRTKVPELGQTETDEVYVGLDRYGAHYVFPVQAKGGRDRHSIVQLEQDFAMAGVKFPELVCRPLAVQFLRDGGLAVMEFVDTRDGVKLADERHYELVPIEELSGEEIASYRSHALMRGSSSR